MYFNRVLIAGNVTSDVELKETAKSKVVNTSIAFNGFYADDQGERQQSVDYFDVTVWGKQAESFAKHVTKGSNVFVEGVLKQNRWEDQETGAKRSKVYVHVLDWRFTSPKPTGSDSQLQAAKADEPKKSEGKKK